MMHTYVDIMADTAVFGGGVDVVWRHLHIIIKNTTVFDW